LWTPPFIEALIVGFGLEHDDSARPGQRIRSVGGAVGTTHLLFYSGNDPVVSEHSDVLHACGLETIQSLTGEIVRKSSRHEGTCVYRGEPECYPVVSSSLYRRLPDSRNEAFDMARVEQETVDNARQYTTLTHDDEILAEVQHYGGATNLIDFTDDYLIALFFASLASEEKDGRVVLHWPHPDTVMRPKRTINRVVFQKSVFVRPPRGFILPDRREETVIVPSGLKAGIVSYLERFHGITERAVFNDIHGFIRHQAPDRSRYAQEFRETLAELGRDTGPYLALCLNEGLVPSDVQEMRHANHQKGMVYADGDKSTISFRPAPTATERNSQFFLPFAPNVLVTLFSRYIETGGHFLPLKQCYRRRGEARLYLGETDLALSDFEEALAQVPDMAEALHGRGNAYAQQGKIDRAMQDLDEALRLKPELPGARLDRGNLHLRSGSLEQATRDYDTAGSMMRMGAYRQCVHPGDAQFFRAVARTIRHDWAAAKADFISARNEGVLVASSFRNIHGGVAAFESEHDFHVPSDIATMLHVA